MPIMQLTTDQLQAGDTVYVDGLEIKLEGRPISYPGTWGLVRAWVYMPIVKGTNPFDGTSRLDVKGTDSVVWTVSREVTS